MYMYMTCIIITMEARVGPLNVLCGNCSEGNEQVGTLHCIHVVLYRIFSQGGELLGVAM